MTAAGNVWVPHPSGFWKGGAFAFWSAGPTLRKKREGWGTQLGIFYYRTVDARARRPLQHIPIVNTIYRWATGDVPGNIARVVGDGLYGGPIGLAAGMLSVAVKDDTGKDPGEMVMGLLTGSDTAEVKLGSAAALPAAPAPPRQALRPPPPCRPRRPFPRRAPRRVRAPRQRRP